jgi:hypothetical protein
MDTFFVMLDLQFDRSILGFRRWRDGGRDRLHKARVGSIFFSGGAMLGHPEHRGG